MPGKESICLVIFLLVIAVYKVCPTHKEATFFLYWYVLFAIEGKLEEE